MKMNQKDLYFFTHINSENDVSIDRSLNIARCVETFAALPPTEPEKRGRKSRFPTCERPSAVLDRWESYGCIVRSSETFETSLVRKWNLSWLGDHSDAP